MSYRFPVIRRRGEKILPAFSPAGTIFQVISGERDASSSGCNESELSRGDREIEGVTRIDLSQARETRSRSRNPLRRTPSLPPPRALLHRIAETRETRARVSFLSFAPASRCSFSVTMTSRRAGISHARSTIIASRVDSATRCGSAFLINERDARC